MVNIRVLLSCVVFLWVCDTICYAQILDSHIISGPATRLENMVPVDMDGDGDLDLCFGSNESRVGWIERTENDQFFAQHAINVMDYLVQVIEVGDLDGDGDQDVIMGSETTYGQDDAGELLWFENMANGVEWETHIIETGFIDIHAIRAFDIDEDGDLDVFASASGYNVGLNGTILVYENSGDGTFYEPEPIVGNTYGTEAIDLVDIDNNGSIELMYAFNSLFDPYLAGNSHLGGVMFSSQTVYGNGIGMRDLHAGDLNGDDLPEMIVATIFGAQIFENTGGNFIEYPDYWLELPENNGEVVTTVDIDGDGDEDIVVSTNNEGLGYFENLGDLVFGDWTTLYFEGEEGGDLLSTDFDQDGHTDLIWHLRGKEIYFLPNSGDYSFPLQTIAPVEFGITGIELLDINNDGLLDVLATSTDLLGESDSPGLSWYLNLDGLNFGTRQTLLSMNDEVICLETGDLDDDGDEDIAVVTEADECLIYLLEDGTIVSEIELLTDSLDKEEVFLHDANGDGKEDLFVKHDGNNWSIVYQEEGGTFNSNESLSSITDASVYGIEEVDMDFDGDMDLVMSGYPFNWLENDGGSYITHFIANSNSARILKIKDLDNDGDLDIVSPIGNSVFIFRNEGPNSFLSESYYFDISSPVDIEVFDIENDGDNDVVVGAGLNLMWIMENDGSSDFIVSSFNPLSAFGIEDLELTDLNGDSYLEIFVASITDGRIMILESMGTEVPTEITKLNHSFGVYPNPSSDQVFLKGTPSSGIQSFNLLNCMGQIVMSGACNEGQGTIDVSHLTQGVYFIHFPNHNSIAKLVVR